MPDYLFVAAGLAAVFVLVALARAGHLFRCLLFSAATGNAALLVISWMGSFTGVALTPNLFTVGTATILGIPGVLAMLLARLLFSA